MVGVIPVVGRKDSLVATLMQELTQLLFDWSPDVDGPWGLLVVCGYTDFNVLEMRVFARRQITRAVSGFAKYWEMVANKGQFQGTAPLIWRNQGSPFAAFHAFSMWLFGRVQRTSHINLLRLAEHLYDYLIDELGLDKKEVGTTIVADLHRTGGRGIPKRLQQFQTTPAPSRKSMSRSTGRERQERRQ